MAPRCECKSCAFWNAPDHVREGRSCLPMDCRKHAPISILPQPRYDKPSAYWPTTNFDDWCGDWKSNL